MAGPAFAGRRARFRLGQLAAFGAVVLVITAALAVIGGAIAPVLDGGARTIIADSGATASAMRIRTAISTDPPAQNEMVEAAVATALRDFPVEVVRTISGPADAIVDGVPVVVQAYADPGIADVASLTAGDWPMGTDQAAIQDAAAATLSLTVGDTLVLGDRTLTVTGLWRATDPGAPRWFGDPAVASGGEDSAVGPVLVDEAVLSAVPERPQVRWTLVPDPEALAVARLPELSNALARLDTEVGRMARGDSAVLLEGSLPESVARAVRVTAVSAGVLGLPLVLIVVAGVIVLGLIARSIAAGRGLEFLLLRARGASLPAITGAAAREAGVIAVIAATLGAIIAVVLLRSGALAGVSGEPGILLVTAIAAGVAALAVTVTTVATVTELRAPVTGRAESGRAAFLASLGPLALATVAAGFAVSQFLSLGSPVVVRADGVVRTDPLALTAPVLVLLAAALAVPVVVGPVVAVAERIARASRGILPVLPLRQLARRARSLAAGVLVVALAAGAVALAAVFHVAATEVRERVERAATGADLRIVLPVPPTIGAGHPGATVTLLDGVGGVDSSFAVLHGVASVGADAIPLIAGDADLLAAAPSAPAQLAPLVTELTASRRGAELPSGARSLTVTAEIHPGDGVPSGLDVEVVLWLSGPDGSAVRVPLGSAALVEGIAEVTGEVPPARSVSAIEFQPPALPDATLVDIVVQRISAPAGDVVAFDGTTARVTSDGKAVRVLPQPATIQPIPVALGAGLAEQLGAKAGTEFVFRVTGVAGPIPARVAGVLPSLPGQSGSVAMLIDLQTLQGRGVELGGSVPAANELWVTSPDPDATAVRVGGVLTGRADIVTARTHSPRAVLDPTLLLVEVGVAVTVLLSVLGFAAVAASISARRRAELTPLRSLGMSMSRIRSARAIELATTAVLAVLLGVVAGLVTGAIVVPGLTAVLA